MVKPLKTPRPSRAADRAAAKQEQRPAGTPPQQLQVQLPPMTVDAVNLILEGLGQLPLARSKGLFDAIQSAAEAQVRKFVDEHNAAVKAGAAA